MKNVMGVVGIVGLAWGFYSTWVSQANPELTALVSPTRGIVVKQGAASRLDVQFDGRPITTDVTVAQIAFWNAGRGPVRSADVLAQAAIRTDPPVPILEAQVRYRTRDVTGFQIDLAEIQEGRLGLSWTVLESKDGAIMQLLYSGGPDVKLIVEGVVIGQKQIVNAPPQIEHSRTPPSRNQQWVVVVFGCLAILAMVVMTVRDFKKRSSDTGSKIFAITLTLWVCIVWLYISWGFWNQAEPPFPF